MKPRVIRIAGSGKVLNVEPTKFAGACDSDPLNSGSAPKPIRDRGRLDNDLLNRVSTIQVTPNGWVQTETNDKVTKAGKVVATEVGWVEYRRTGDDSPCEKAKTLHPSE